MNECADADDLLREQAYLIERGVRSLALVRPTTVQNLLRVGGSRVIPFSLPAGLCGYASHAWIVDLLSWAQNVPRVQRDRIMGLLLGYNPESIRQFEELGTTTHDPEDHVTRDSLVSTTVDLPADLHAQLVDRVGSDLVESSIRQAIREMLDKEGVT